MSKKIKIIESNVWSNVIIGIAILVIFLAVITYGFVAMNINKQCIVEPLQYGADQIQDKAGGVVQCACLLSNPQYQPLAWQSPRLNNTSGFYNLTEGTP